MIVIVFYVIYVVGMYEGIDGYIQCITFVIRFNRFSVVRAMLRHAQYNPEKYR